MRIVTVLKSRGVFGPSEFQPVHVKALQRQVEKWAPFAQFTCLSDVPVDGVECVPLKRNWPGWWSKLELFDPELGGDFLFMDLDTLIVGPLDDFEKITKLTLLRDFYRDGKKLKEGLGGGLIYVPAGGGREVWDEFNVNPRATMALYRRGDQHFFETFWLKSADRFQDVLPGQVVSWKCHCAATDRVPPEARVVCFHGIPRPWAVPQFRNLYA